MMIIIIIINAVTSVKSGVPEGSAVWPSFLYSVGAPWNGASSNFIFFPIARSLILGESPFWPIS